MNIHPSIKHSAALCSDAALNKITIQSEPACPVSTNQSPASSDSDLSLVGDGVDDGDCVVGGVQVEVGDDGNSDDIGNDDETLTLIAQTEAQSEMIVTTYKMMLLIVLLLMLRLRLVMMGMTMVMVTAMVMVTMSSSSPTSTPTPTASSGLVTQRLIHHHLLASGQVKGE